MQTLRARGLGQASPSSSQGSSLPPGFQPSPLLSGNQQPPAGYGQSQGELWFIYSFPDVTLAANASTTAQIQILSDADFLVTWINGHWTGKFTVLIQDASSSQAFMTNPVNGPDFIGTGQNPHPMLPMYRFAKNHVINFQLTDTSGAQNVIGITLEGRKLLQS